MGLFFFTYVGFVWFCLGFLCVFFVEVKYFCSRFGVYFLRVVFLGYFLVIGLGLIFWSGSGFRD